MASMPGLTREVSASASSNDGAHHSQNTSFGGGAPPRAGGASSMYGMGRRKRVLPLGAARKYVMEPHGYYDSRAEVLALGPSLEPADTRVKFTRSKIRCSSFAEWMEIADPETGKPLWRIEARFADRSFYAPEVVYAGKHRKQAFLTAVRLYRAYDADPTLMLVHRDRDPCGLGEPFANKKIEVYMCRSIGDKSAADLDPDAELDTFLRDDTPGRVLQPRIDPKPHYGPTPETDESFYFMGAKPGEDLFTINVNGTLTAVTLSAETEFVQDDGQAPVVEKRVLANMKRVEAHSPRKIEIDSALDDGLVIALFACVDQLLLSHDALEYDVEWPNDFSLSFDACVADRKYEGVRQAPSFLKDDEPPNKHQSSYSKPRGCFFF